MIITRYSEYILDTIIILDPSKSLILFKLFLHEILPYQ